MSGATLRALAPQAFSHALDALSTAYALVGGDQVQHVYGPAAGPSNEAITSRLARAEGADLVLLPSRLLDEQVRAGRVIGASLTPVMRSSIGMCVPLGRPVPDIGSVAGLTDALLQARSIALSAAGSGVYVSSKLLHQLGIEAEVGARCLCSDDEPVGQVVARGGADLGFQQICELLPVPGISFAGALPDAVQLHTDVSAGLLVGASQADAAARWLAYLTSPAALELITAAGLTPIDKTNGDTQP